MPETEGPDAVRRAALDLIDAGHAFLDALAAMVDVDAEAAEDLAAQFGRGLRGLLEGLGGDAAPADGDPAAWESIPVDD